MSYVRKNIFLWYCKKNEPQVYEEKKKEIQSIKSYQPQHWRKKKLELFEIIKVY